MSPKKPGRHAETSFAALCAAYGATCNYATEDERGWDFFVQFPRTSTRALPLDMTPAAEKCLTQIKATSGPPAGIRLKLSNALEFATSDAPCFVLLFCYMSADNISSVYVLHFWEDEISRTLRRARELDSLERRDLHRFTMHFSTGFMRHLSPKELLAYLESTVRNFGPAYGDRKRDICARVGFEGVAIEGHISFGNGITLDDLVDAQIGLKDSVEIADFTARSVRFGIPARTPFVSGGYGHGSIRSNAQKCIIRVSSEQCAREVSLPSDLYAPSIPGIAKENLRLRIANPLIQLVLHVSDERLNFTSRWTDFEKRSLEDAAAVLDLVHIFGSGKVHIQITFDGNVLGGGFGEIKGLEITPAIKAVDKFVRLIRAQTPPHEVPTDFQVSLRELFDRAYEIAEHNLLTMEPSVDGNCTIKWNGEPHPGPARLFYSISVELPKHVVYTIVRRRLDMELKEEGRALLFLREIDYTRVRILPGSIASTKSIIDNEVNMAAQQTSDLVLVLNDYQAQQKARQDSANTY